MCHYSNQKTVLSISMAIDTMGVLFPEVTISGGFKIILSSCQYEQQLVHLHLSNIAISLMLAALHQCSIFQIQKEW